MKIRVLCFLGAICLLQLNCSDVHQNNYALEDLDLIPMPKQIELSKGAFKFDANTSFVVTKPEHETAAQILVDLFEQSSGMHMSIVAEGEGSNTVKFNTDEGLIKGEYSLEISSNTIEIRASDLRGFVYGIESLRQLLPKEIESSSQISNVKWIIPALQIHDRPRFKWRGLMLDLSRHFFDKEYIMKTIDRLAYFKMNTLHLHLVDDQGWRIEIKKYPRLTEVGAMRVDHEDKHWNARPTPSVSEEATYGGYLTQEEIKEIVAYAGSKGIDVVPEIEMPAHVMSAIASYPWLSCNENHIAVPSGGVWPITEIYCAGKESTFEFIEDVLDEVIELFPSRYIHVGGDEATKDNWETCRHCQKRIRDEGLENVEELQSYFIQRMERYISSKGRILIGWDEILEGGLAEGAVVMSWRGVKGGVEAAEMGHDVIMTPGTHCYFDHYQGNQDIEPLAIGGYSPLSKVYGFDPIVEGMNEEEKSHVLGGQANLWSEYIPTPSHSEYMLYPRLAALAEAVWCPKEDRDWNSFANRIEGMFPRMDLMDINYARSVYQVTANSSIDKESGDVNLILKSELPNAVIHYDIDDSNLTSQSPIYKTPLKMDKSSSIKAAVFDGDQQIGDVFEDHYVFHKAVGKSISFQTPYHDNYQGVGETTLSNVLRGTTNFHDGQWLGWLDSDMIATIDLGQAETISHVTLGCMDNQGPEIYMPTAISVSISMDGNQFHEVRKIDIPYTPGADPEVKDMKISFDEVEAQYVKVHAQHLKNSPKGGGVWLFVDEILVE